MAQLYASKHARFLVLIYYQTICRVAGIDYGDGPIHGLGGLLETDREPGLAYRLGYSLTIGQILIDRARKSHSHPVAHRELVGDHIGHAPTKEILGHAVNRRFSDAIAITVVARRAARVTGI